MSVAAEEHKRTADSRIQERKERKEQSGGVWKGSRVKGLACTLPWSSQSRASLDTAWSSGLEKCTQVG